MYLDVSVNPVSTSRQTGTLVTVTVTAQGGAVCEGIMAYQLVVQGPNSTPSPASSSQALEADNSVVLGYTGSAAGSGSYRVWLDFLPNGSYDSGEPTAFGSVSWMAPTATPTPAP